MRSLWRFVLVWLMALAIPVQGVAAVGMLHCAAAPAHQAHTLHDGHHDGHHHAGGDQAQVGDQAEVGDDAGLSPADDGHTLGHKCSACAACCAGLGLPAHVAEFGSPGVAQAIALPPGAAPASIVPGRLDRPPRPTLA